MKRTLVLAGALSLVTIVSLAAQAPPAPKPGPEHERLKYFVGKWTTEGEMKPGPMGPGGKFTSTDTCEWFEGRFAVVCHSDGKMAAGPAKSIGILGYSAEEKVYTYYGVDNSNMTIYILNRDTLQELGRLGRSGRATGEFHWLHQVSVDSRGNIYTTETYEGSRLQRFIFKGMGPVPAGAEGEKSQGVLWPKDKR